MKKILNILVGAALLTLLPGSVCLAATTQEPFDMKLALTRQDTQMDWWFAVPPQFGPQVTLAEQVTPGEKFTILPVFEHFGIAPDNEIKIRYDVEILHPDGTLYKREQQLTGFTGKVPGPILLPAADKLVVAFDPDDPLGEYRVNVTAYDFVKEEQSDRSRTIRLAAFDHAPEQVDVAEWYLNYPVDPRPSLALRAFTSAPGTYLLDAENMPSWSALWFYKVLYEQNDFLIPHTVAYYKTKATPQQRKDIFLLFHLLGKTAELTPDGEMLKFRKSLWSVQPPDPYLKIVSTEQLEMLWAEFFSNARIAPVRQLLTALNLSVHAGAMEQMQSGKLPETEENTQKAYLDAVFQTALWSIMSNAGQNQLLFQYLVGLYESGDLTQEEKKYLGAILRKVVEEKK